MKRAYVTAMSHGDGYAAGVEALGSSIKASGTSAPMVLMATPDVSPRARARLAGQGWLIRDVEPMAARASAARPRLGHCFVKLRAWQLTEFDKVLWLDADTLILNSVDDLFERPSFAAAPDMLRPDHFNPGVMVLDPANDTFEEMMGCLSRAARHEGGVHGFLNRFFADWSSGPKTAHLPIGDNMLPSLHQLLRHHRWLERPASPPTRILHYAAQKPWHLAPQLTGASCIWWSHYHRARPEEDRPWKRRVHALEDWTFDRVVDLFVG